MTRMLIVRPETTELYVFMQNGCRSADARLVTMEVIRADAVCQHQLDPCVELCQLDTPLEEIREHCAFKRYTASRIESGLVTFALDEDMIDAPEGWYRARIGVDGCKVAEISLLVLCSGMSAKPFAT